jgi:hypothetical protein
MLLGLKYNAMHLKFLLKNSFKGAHLDNWEGNSKAQLQKSYIERKEDGQKCKGKVTPPGINPRTARLVA